MGLLLKDTSVNTKDPIDGFRTAEPYGKVRMIGHEALEGS
jgi:hypothetical protein